VSCICLEFFPAEWYAILLQNKYLTTHVFLMRLPTTDERLLFEFV